MGWETSSRRSSLPPNWRQLRETQLQADSFRCTAKLEDGSRCEREAEEVDHVHGPHNDTLTSLCAWHHGKKSAAEGNRAYWRNRRAQESKFRRDDPHPGSLRR